MTINLEAGDSGGRIEVEATDDGMVLLSWLGPKGESLRWWKLAPEQADYLGDVLKGQAMIAGETARRLP